MNGLKSLARILSPAVEQVPDNQRRRGPHPHISSSLGKYLHDDYYTLQSVSYVNRELVPRRNVLRLDTFIALEQAYAA